MLFLFSLFMFHVTWIFPLALFIPILLVKFAVEKRTRWEACDAVEIGIVMKWKKVVSFDRHVVTQSVGWLE